MKISSFLGLILAASPVMGAEAQLQLSFSKLGDRVELSWPASRKAADGTEVRPFFEVQGSSNLTRWVPVGERMRAQTEGSLKTALPLTGPNAFYRLQMELPRSGLKLAEGGAEAFGYAEDFARKLAAIGQIT